MLCSMKIFRNDLRWKALNSHLHAISNIAWTIKSINIVSWKLIVQSLDQAKHLDDLGKGQKISCDSQIKKLFRALSIWSVMWNLYIYNSIAYLCWMAKIVSDFFTKPQIILKVSSHMEDKYNTIFLPSWHPTPGLSVEPNLV